jgi:adenosine deaminase
MANSTFEERKAALEHQRAQIMQAFAQEEAATVMKRPTFSFWRLFSRVRQQTLRSTGCCSM